MQESTDIKQAEAKLEESVPKPQMLIDMSFGQLLRIAISGAVVGALVWGVTILLQNIVIEPLLCRSADTLSMCGDAGSVASNAAAIIVGAVGVMVLVKLSVYRPLLISLAAIVTLWSAYKWLGDMSWLGSISWLALLYAFTYALYSWVVRIYYLPIAVAALIVIAIAARLVISS